MVNFRALTDAYVTTMQAIPELVAALGGDPASIVGYVDEMPDRNSVSRAIYQMKPGTMLIFWQETLFAQSDVEAWMHRFMFYVRAQRGTSALDLVNLVVDGVPNPGDGLRWRFCAVMPGVLPSTISNISRPIDEEGIDYFALTVDTNETGDW